MACVLGSPPLNIHPVFHLYCPSPPCSAAASLRHGSANMSLLVALGTTAAFGYSLVAMGLAAAGRGGGGGVYFETSALIITFVLLGKWLEVRMPRVRARAARCVHAGTT